MIPDTLAITLVALAGTAHGLMSLRWGGDWVRERDMGEDMGEER